MIAGFVNGIEPTTDSGITIEGNKIGTNAAGTAALPNQVGIYADVEPGPDTLIVGGTTPGSGNLISGNSVFGGFGGGIYEGNLIGTDVTGELAIPNQNGLNHPDVVGGTASRAARNIISGNAVDGVGYAQVGRGTTSGRT